ncbi:helix-turn-helix transcriptional regulator [Pantoea agglomerans]|uniref:helix-turn-helix domain-containing protein n=1 Tax=Enterobacter agglomerans TaxID=549 RepID=UPI0016540395|nr:helix-turn-helix transcriptional regulator [Pantoea agglomerans]
MKAKSVSFAELKNKAFQNPDVLAAYRLERREEELQGLLAEMKGRAGLNSKQVAERMGISQPAVSKLEKNAIKASLSTLERYAAACGTSIKISMG